MRLSRYWSGSNIETRYCIALLDVHQRIILVTRSKVGQMTTDNALDPSAVHVLGVIASLSRKSSFPLCSFHSAGRTRGLGRWWLETPQSRRRSPRQRPASCVPSAVTHSSGWSTCLDIRFPTMARAPSPAQRAVEPLAVGTMKRSPAHPKDCPGSHKEILAGTHLHGISWSTKPEMARRLAVMDQGVLLGHVHNVQNNVFGVMDRIPVPDAGAKARSASTCPVSGDALPRSRASYSSTPTKSRTMACLAPRTPAS